ncbi:hypothetical protein FVEG_15211 [Fusarium verticillioides 7600]|uniref:Uncharacterized protein n=1 Tax=Gibberella moniliformis (strain M3125 / FGSC 7600) TaxID=334819 RepID=W7M0B2_GIBM7|nr:hypothetical protein FVEG_15211 [Fusarium verticillioides 7600]EWG41010.1 hypothetical protein FVEG_15211 [Fusarium verticillioides 7600]
MPSSSELFTSDGGINQLSKHVNSCGPDEAAQDSFQLGQAAVSALTNGKRGYAWSRLLTAVAPIRRLPEAVRDSLILGGW